MRPGREKGTARMGERKRKANGHEIWSKLIFPVCSLKKVSWYLCFVKIEKCLENES